MNKLIVLLLAVLTVAVFTVQAGNQHDSRIPVITDFSELAKQAREKNLPILLMVSQDHCPYCDLLKDAVLNPMVLSGDYEDKVVMAELLIDFDYSITDFDGSKIYPGKIAADYKTYVTPTLIFIDHQGKEVHQRILGVNTVEMFGYYLDEALDASLAAVRKGEPYAYKATKQEQLTDGSHQGL